uniref:Uncharacterized protein n=1 Tax=Echeneis naucrates TaxID=173247 RepID=A0A665XDJ2_ECHNA
MRRDPIYRNGLRLPPVLRRLCQLSLEIPE